MRMNSRKPGGLYPVREDSKIDAEIKIRLTTVCIKTGVVRIPHRHRGVFVGAGSAFEFDGLPVPVRYAESGELTGLRDILHEADVRPNDALVLQLSDGLVALSFAIRERRSPVTRPPTVKADDKSLSQENSDAKAPRKVRINTRQYYPLETPLPSALAGREDHDQMPAGVSVTAHRRSVVEGPKDTVSTASPPGSQVIGEGRGDYSVSEDFERWIASPSVPEVGGGSTETEMESEPPQSHYDDAKSPAEVMSVIEGFISLPDTPAIIQTQKIADELGLAIELCEQALERISEDHERVSRIRNGAYMIRQKRSTVKV